MIRKPPFFTNILKFYNLKSNLTAFKHEMKIGLFMRSEQGSECSTKWF